ncbi:MAG: Gfo/Idh/MocA family oxidoreductase [Candidatus Omnitrophota bacterium]
MLKIGVIGYGYWGPNIVRNFNMTRDSKVTYICDEKPQVLKRAEDIYPHTKLSTHATDITRAKDIDAVAIITPVYTHFQLAKEALENGKHIFIEKPFTRTVAEAEELIALAGKNNLMIMVDHTFLFTGAVRKVKELIDNQVLGDLYYYDSTRVSLGLFQQDVNVIWDLAPHDLSIMDYCLNKRPIAITANGVDHFKKGAEDIAYITVYYDNNLIAHINVNWLSPVKVRTTFIAGQKKMLVWNDLEADEKVKVYDKGVNVENREGMYRLWVDYRSGDMWAPRLDHTEALKMELEYFVDCLMNNQTPFNDGHAGLRVVKMLLATDESLKKEGKMIKI